MPTNIRLYGTKQIVAATSESTDDFFKLEESWELSQSRAAGEINNVAIEDHHYVEIVFSDGTTWFGDNKNLKEIFPELKVQSRSAQDAPVLPASLVSDDATRGLVGDIALKLLRKFVKKQVKQKIRNVARGIEMKGFDNTLKKISDKLLPVEGGQPKDYLEKLSGKLYALTADFSTAPFNVQLLKKNADKHTLLFIHGTSSSSYGAFCELKGSKVWDEIVNYYGSNIICFDHLSLTAGPIKNVYDLINELPGNTTYDVITHSRGGLVGELLMRFTESPEGFLQQSKDLFKEEERKEELDLIDKASTTAAKKKIKVGRFIRVAATARGTSLLSERTDIFLNTLINLINVSCPILTPIVGGLKMLIAETVDSKNSFNELPGLEAQRPGSLVIKALNTCKCFDENQNPVGFENRLAVISGNGKFSLSLNGLKIVLTKFFFKWKENDLVVDTASMYQGCKRDKPVLYFLDNNPNTNHFNYFLNETTRDALKQALFFADSLGGIPTFKEVQGENFDAAANRGVFGLENGRLQPVMPTGKKPILILLPGIMGSFLEQGDTAIWINYLRFATGGLGRLVVKDNDNISATGVIKTAYKDLAEHLSGSYDVMVFPFDWRRPLALAGEKLKTTVEELKKKFNVTISFAGHSMGGLVVRDLIINHPDTWKWLNEQPNFRTVLLGTPWLGSYRIPHVLSGKDSIIKQLDLIDFAHNKRKLINLFSKFPGLLDLLPIHDSKDFGSIKLWDDFTKAAGLETETIPPDLLKNFTAYTKNIKANIDSIDYSNIVYVAGKDKETIKDYTIENGQLKFFSTAEGDQSVTWASGIPAKINRSTSLYYTNATHGGLSKKPFLFTGIMDILKTGSTASNEFSRLPLPVSEGERSFESKEKFEFETSEAGIETGILGLDDLLSPEENNTPILNVSVSNGDLMFARYPVMIGHFAYDDIYNAEEIANTYLKNDLRHKHRLGLYPGSIGTSEYFPNGDKNSEFRGCVIVGLGLSETLNAYQLTVTVEKAVSDYLLTHCKSDVAKQENNQKKKLGLSTLLIGAGYAGMAVESACRAIMQGVINANQGIIATTGMQDLYISHLEFIELYEDKSISCFTSINSLLQGNSDGMNLGWIYNTINKNPGARKRLFTDIGNEWWQRLSVQSEKDNEGALTKLSFYSSTNNAREEKQELTQSLETLESMIDDISSSKRWMYEKARALFELLVPSYFKETIKRNAPVMWVLDNYAASFPWELLQTGTQKEKPLCIAAPMIRQLSISDYEPVSEIKSNNVIIIGDPDLAGFDKARQLPGAAKEAQEVYNLLSREEYKSKINVEDVLVNRSHTEILFNLYKQPYKLIHIAAHGFVNEKNNNETGIVIGRSKKNPDKPHYITPGNIAQLPGTPELVFINCCFLGKVNAYAEEYAANRGKMAANIGTELIRKGVKAVVVAGWEVDDSAALAFAKIFYTEMLAGRNFGNAVHFARKYIYTNFKHTNTWGAFQCYGQPLYKLDITAWKKEPLRFYIAEQAENRLDSIISKSEVAFANTQELKKQLAETSLAIKEAGFDNPALKQLEATAYIELNDYRTAIDILNGLFKSESAGFRVNALEKFQQITAKQALLDFKEQLEKNKPDEAAVEKINKTINGCITNLNRLLDIWETSERYSLIGSCYKRMAFIVSHNKNTAAGKKDMNNTLALAAKNYFSAYKIKGDSYSFCNWLSMKIFSGMAAKAWNESFIQRGKEGQQGKEKITLQKINACIKKLEEENRKNQNQDFWNRAGSSDVLLCKFLLKPDDTNYEALKEAYKSIWSRNGSVNKRTAQIENIDLLIYFAEKASKKIIKPKLEKLKKALEAIK